LEESGWKLVHGDVFRPPVYRRLLVALTGAGIQIFFSTFIVIGNTVIRLIYFKLVIVPCRVVGCWRGCLSGARCRLDMAQLTPLPLTVSCFSKIQIGFTFLVPAHLGSPALVAVHASVG